MGQNASHDKLRISGHGISRWVTKPHRSSGENSHHRCGENGHHRCGESGHHRCSGDGHHCHSEDGHRHSGESGEKDDHHCNEHGDSCSHHAHGDGPNFKWLDGRPFLDVKGSQYLLPLDAVEGDRQNARHFVARTAAGTNYMAPIRSILSKPGSKALDIGCGTGIYIIEMAEEFPNAEFTGLDISMDLLNKSNLPPNCHFTLCNALDGLPFPDDTFDFVSQQYMAATWTKPQWNTIISEMVRVLKPGGYIELWEFDYELQSLQPDEKEGAAPGENLSTYLVLGMQTRGLDPLMARRAQGLLASQGLRKVKTSYFSVPFSWGGAVGCLHEDITLQGVYALKPWLMKSLNVDETVFNKMCEERLAQVAPLKLYMNYHQAWAMKSKRAASSEAT